MRSPRAVLLMVGACWLLAAAAMPLVQDEAYYYAWASHLALGYFDHPPLVALIGWTATLAHGVPFIARLGTLLTALLSFLASARLFRILGLRTAKLQATALLLAFGNAMGLILGVITTPDTGLMLAWILALSEAALALQGSRRRWLSAGLATGLGFWSKYMMVLIGPVFLWALIVEARRQPAGGRAALRTPWPYLGGLVALLTVMPHLAWNAEHDWITMRFQLRHGFASNYMNLPRSDVLPWPDLAEVGSREWLLAEPFRAPPEVEKPPKVPTVFDPYLKAFNRVTGFYSSQLAFWGAMLVVGACAWRERRRRGQSDMRGQPDPLDPRSRPLIVAAMAVPLLFFGLLSLGTGVEANWSAMYLFGAAVLLAPLLQERGRALLIAAAANAALVGLVVVQALTGVLPLRPGRDRILAETHGYAGLGRYLAQIEGPLFADSYQITSMVRFYGDGRQVAQWPRMTRDSEFVRLPLDALSKQDLQATPGFWLVTSVFPPHFDGFRAVQMAQLRDCKDADLQVISTLAARDMSSRCLQPIHAWYLVRYETEPRRE